MEPAVLSVGLLLTTFTFGLRHGLDWDHIAAITDIASSQDDARQGLWLSTVYALGHAVVVFALGTLAIVFAERLPEGVDAAMGRVVGATLVLLGLYVFVALARQGRDFRLRSRWLLLFGAVHRAGRWVRDRRWSARPVTIVHSHDHPVDEPHAGSGAIAASDMHASVATRLAHRHPHQHVGSMPADPFESYGVPTAFGIGMIHGVGAETPTQVLLFLTAAGIGGARGGVAVLLVFILGLLASNTAIAAASAFGFLHAGRNFPLYAAVSVIVGAFSLLLGSLLLVGDADVLPALFGDDVTVGTVGAVPTSDG